MNAATEATLDAHRLAGALFDFVHAKRSATPPRLRPADLETYRVLLTKYARRRLRSAADVEDVVQDTLMVALMAPDSFEGRSASETWLVGILKHKIIDLYRRQARKPVFEPQAEQELSDELDAMFTPDGHWGDRPTSWGDPEAALGRREFYDVLEGCLACLPRSCARVFTMRELMELEVSEICDVLGISPGNCHVLLHRARMKLRVLLEQRWFAVRAQNSANL
jgi:RNA polymerase sigma-70 factor, ECF subfamily